MSTEVDNTAYWAELIPSTRDATIRLPRCHAWVEQNNCLPTSYRHWSIQNRDHKTVAQALLDKSMTSNTTFEMLPKDYAFWTILINPLQSYETIAHRCVKLSHRLPKGFEHWRISLQNGWTVAHEYAQYGILPADFKAWDDEVNRNYTVAHIAARHGNLPVGYNDWNDLCTHNNKSGFSTAHMAASVGKLPFDFTQWKMCCSGGWSVAHELALYLTKNENPAMLEMFQTCVPLSVRSKVDLRHGLTPDDILLYHDAGLLKDLR